MEAFWAAPPLSRTLAASTLTLSILVHGKILPGFPFVFYLPALLQLPPQLWRIITSFLITNQDLNILFDTYFMYMYGSKIEIGSSRFSQPGDFFTYLVFVAFTIIGLNVFVTGGHIFCSALVLALAYTSTQEERGHSARFIIINIPAQWTPYAMLLVTLAIYGQHQAKIQATGLIAAHLHDFLTRIWPTFGGGRNLLPTPAFIKRIFQSTEASATRRAYGTAFTPAQRESAPASGSSGGGVLPESWRNRGSGHRLGGD